MSLKSSILSVVGSTRNKNSGNGQCFSTTEAAQTFDELENYHVLGMILFCNAYRVRHGQIALELANNHEKGVNNHPSTFSESFTLLINHTPPKTHLPPNFKPYDETETGLTLAQDQRQ